MFTLNDIFTQLFPALEGMSVDVGTVIVGMLALTVICCGFDFVKDILLNRVHSMANERRANKYLSQAEKSRENMGLYEEGSFAYEFERRIYQKSMNNAVNHESKARFGRNGN